MLKNALTAVIVEDDIKGAKLLAHIIETYCGTIELVGIAYEAIEAYKLINEKKPKVLFLDVLLGDNTCFDLLEKIKFDNLKIVIVSAYDNYAIDAFKYHAIDYILKPIDIDAIINITKKIYRDYLNETYSLEGQTTLLHNILNESNNSNYIAVSSLNDIQVIKYDDILYLQSDGRYTTFFLIAGNKLVATKNIGEYEKSLGTFNFFRIHKKYIINIKYIESIDKRDGGTCHLLTEITLPIAYRRRDSLFRFLNLK